MMKDWEEEEEGGWEGKIERYRHREEKRGGGPERETHWEGVSERETGRQREAQGERPQRGEGEGLKGPQASSNLWHGKKEELVLSVHTHHRRKREDTQHPSSVSQTVSLSIQLLDCHDQSGIMLWGSLQRADFQIPTYSYTPAIIRLGMW